MWKVGGIKIELAIIGRQSFGGEAREISEKRKFSTLWPVNQMPFGRKYAAGG